MDISEILTVRKNKTTREFQPLKNFIKTSDNHKICLEYISNSMIENTEVKKIIANSLLINQVTNIEVYCKDMLDAFFKICDPNITKKTLKEIHKDKYDIDDLVFLYENSIHPIELIAFNQSFQNLSTINHIFSKILKVNVLEDMKSTNFRYKDDEKEFDFKDDKIYSETESLFKIRHELVHNPSYNYYFDIKSITDKLNYSSTFIYALDLILIINFEKTNNFTANTAVSDQVHFNRLFKRLK